MQDYQNKDRLSVSRILSLQRKPKLGRTKPLTGPRVGHGYFKVPGLTFEAHCISFFIKNDYFQTNFKFPGFGDYVLVL